MTEAIQVVTTTASEEDAQRMANALVTRRLAACVQVLGPVTSVYHWEGRLERSCEWLCVAKTDRAHYQAVEDQIRQLHSYQVPEILATPATAGSSDYLQWLESELD